PVVIVPVGRLDRATARAIAFARSISPAVKAVHVATSEESSREFRKRWEHWAGKVPLDVIESPYRSLVPPLLKYIDRIDERADRQRPPRSRRPLCRHRADHGGSRTPWTRLERRPARPHRQASAQRSGGRGARWRRDRPSDPRLGQHLVLGLRDRGSDARSRARG